MRMQLVLLVTSGALVLAGCAKGPESTVEHFHRSIEKGELAEVKALISKRIEEEIHAYGARGDVEFTTVLMSESDKYRNCGGIESVKTTLTGEGETRSGTTTITFKKIGLSECEALNLKTIVIKEDGAWKVFK